MDYEDDRIGQQQQPEESDPQGMGLAEYTSIVREIERQTVALAKDVAAKAEQPSAMDTVASKVTVAEAAPTPANIVGDDVVIKDPTDRTPPIH